MSLAPDNSYFDLETDMPLGRWVESDPLTCPFGPGDGRVVYSTLTDPDGERSGLSVIYTEWGAESGVTPFCAQRIDYPNDPARRVSRHYTFEATS